jgi:hypothetical protein
VLISIASSSALAGENLLDLSDECRQVCRDDRPDDVEVDAS